MSGGGFRLEFRNGPAFRARPTREGFSVVGGDLPAPCRLVDERTRGGNGFVVLHGRAREIARSTHLEGAEAHVLSLDGRLYRVLRHSGRGGGVDLVDWEAGGTYYRARPARVGWRIEPTVAGVLLENAAAVLLVLAAEIVASDDEGTRG